MDPKDVHESHIWKYSRTPFSPYVIWCPACNLTENKGKEFLKEPCLGKPVKVIRLQDGDSHVDRPVPIMNIGRVTRIGDEYYVVDESREYLYHNVRDAAVIVES